MSALQVGLLDSVAWRQDGRVHVDLHLPEVATQQEVQVRFRDGDRRVRRVAAVSAEPDGGVMLRVAVRGPHLASGLWRIAVRVGEAEAFTRVDARLLVHRGQPVALLPGPAPATRMREPEPRPVVRHPADAVRGLPARVVRGVRRRLGR